MADTVASGDAFETAPSSFNPFGAAFETAASLGAAFVMAPVPIVYPDREEALISFSILIYILKTTPLM